MFKIKENIFKKLIINKNKKVKDVLEIFNSTGVPTCFIKNKNNQIVATATDGDIRRKYINKKKDEMPISKFMNSSPLHVKENDNPRSVEILMKSKAALYVPILNKNKKMIGLFSWNDHDQKKEFDNFVIIMVGGLGNRLRPLTKNTPKPMLEIGGKPILEHLIFNFKSQGFSKFILLTHYKSESIKKYFKNGSKFGVKIKYIKEKNRMGTAGGLSLLKKIKNTFIVINGDILSEINFESFIKYHEKNKAFASMTVKRTHSENPYGVIKTKGNRIIDIKEKPVEKFYVNTGIYCFSPKLYEYLKKKKINFLDMNELFMDLKKNKKKIIFFASLGDWIDIGSMKNYMKVKKDLKSNVNF